jgi:hypothetical protein
LGLLEQLVLFGLTTPVTTILWLEDVFSGVLAPLRLIHRVATLVPSQSFVLVVSFVKDVASCQLVNVYPPELAHEKPVGCVQVPTAVEQTSNFIPLTIWDVPNLNPLLASPTV